MNGIWKTTLKRFVSDVRGFSKDEKDAEITTAVVGMANNLNLAVGEDDTEELLFSASSPILTTIHFTNGLKNF